MVKTPELDTPATLAASSGLGVAGVGLASTSSFSSASPPSLAKAPRWSSIRGRFSTIQSRESPSDLPDSVDDGMWDKNDAAFLEEVARDSPLLLSSSDRFDSSSDRDPHTGRASMSITRPTRDADQHSSPRRQSLQLTPSSSFSRPSTAASLSSTFSAPMLTNDQALAPSHAMGPAAYRSRPMRRMASGAVLPDLPEQNHLDDVIAISSPATSSSSAASMTPPLLPPIGSPASFMAASFTNASSSPVVAKSTTHDAAITAARRNNKNRSSLVLGLRKLMGKRESEARAAGLLVDSASTMSRSREHSTASLTTTLDDEPLRPDAGIPANHRGGLNLLGLAPDALGPPAAIVQASPDRGNARKTNKNATIRGSPSIARKSPSLDLLRSFGSLARTSSNKASARNSVIEHISHEEARKLTGNAGPVILETKEALAEHQSKYATFPKDIGLPDRSNFDLHQDMSFPVPPRRANPAGSSPIAPHVALPSRPQRPDQAIQRHVAAPVEILTQAVSVDSTSAPAHVATHVNGVSSSGSSMLSSSSATTDPSLVSRAPFSFQSQTYRPYSSDSRTSRTSQLSPPSSPSSFASNGFEAAGNALKPTHRTVSSLGSQAARSISHGERFDGFPEDSASALMPPPPAGPAGVRNAARGHASRRSLSSLVGSRPWSSFMGSPVLASNGPNSQLHSHKGLSGASISRPMSVSTSAFSSGLYDGRGAADADLTFRASDFERARRVAAAAAAAQEQQLRPRNRLDSNFSEPGFAISGRGSVGAINSSNQIRSSCWSMHDHSSSLSSPSNPLAAVSAAAASSLSSSSQHSHQSYHSCSHQSGASTASATASAPSTTLGSALAPPTSSSNGLGLTSSSSSSLGHQVSHPDRRRPVSSLLGDQAAAIPSAPNASAALIRSSSSRPFEPAHRHSASGSSLSHRKRPSFGLAIEPAAHSAFDSIPSPLLRHRRISLAHPESSSPQRPYSTSSASAVRTPSGSSYSTSPNASARASAATLSSRHTSDHHDDSVEIETLLDGSPKKASYLGPTSFAAAVPALENAMAAATIEPTAYHRHSVSVPMDEDDSPRQQMEENWSRITGENEQVRSYKIHSPNEEASAPTSSGRLSQASKDIAFGSLAGMVSKVFEHPFDLVKVRLQTQSADRPARYAGAFDCFKQTYLQEGVRGLYRGLSMPVFGATLENACLFFVYNQIQSAIRWANGEARVGSAAKADAESPLSIPQLAIAAAGAGAMTSLVLTPIELIKCKMQVQMITREQHVAAPSSIASSAPVKARFEQSRSIYTSAIRASSSTAKAQAFKSLDGPLTLLRRTVASDGIRGLWLGQTGTLLRETGGGVAWFLAFESCSRYLISRKKTQWKRDDVTKKDLSSLELVGAGALAGVSYNVVLFPADSVKSTMQTEQEMRAVSSPRVEGKWKGTGFYETFKKIYRTRGVRGLYAGCGVTCLRSAPSSAIIFLLYNKLEKLSDEYGL